LLPNLFPLFLLINNIANRNRASEIHRASDSSLSFFFPIPCLEMDNNQRRISYVGFPTLDF
jgi:hypothetical protein